MVEVWPADFAMLLLISARRLDKPGLPQVGPRVVARQLPRGGPFRRAVERLPGAGDLGLIADRPFAECRDRRQQIAPERGELIIDARRNGRIHGTRDQSVALEPAQSQG